jgi:hypothetical protein
MQMFRILAMVLSVVMVTISLGSTALAQVAADAQTAQKMQIEVAKLGVGRDARVEAKLKDGKKVKGYVSVAEDDSFTVTDLKTGTSQTLAYTDVLAVKKPRKGLSPMTWGIIAGAAVAAIIVGKTVLHPVLCDGGAGC